MENFKTPDTHQLSVTSPRSGLVDNSCDHAANDHIKTNSFDINHRSDHAVKMIKNSKLVGGVVEYRKEADFRVDVELKSLYYAILEKLKQSHEFVNLKTIYFKKDGCFFVDSSRNILYYISKNKLHRWWNKEFLNYRIQRHNFQSHPWYIAHPKLQTQGMWSAVGDLAGSISNAVIFLNKVKNNLSNPQLVAWVMDVLTVTFELNDPFFWRPISILKFFVRVHSIMLRYKDFKENTYHSYTAQALDDFNSCDAIILLLSCYGLPDSIVKSLKQIALVTNKKILDSPNVFLDLVNKFCETFHSIVQWIKDSNPDMPWLGKIADILLYPVSFISGFHLTKEISDIVVKFQKNHQIIFDPAFRQRVLETHKASQGNIYITNLVNNQNYKTFSSQYNVFKTIYKMTATYDSSSRQEPVCIVFEGKAGSGKSSLMNKLVDYLVYKSFSVYSHSCPTVDAGKDFYDDYMNQDVFVMDDVGQQGISQWRQIINFVSPVKYPLDCASAEMKNTKFFNSKLILLTTNNFTNLTGFTKSDCISEPVALFRRCHVINFDSVNFVRGQYHGKLQYKKYDYRNRVWKEEFLTPPLFPNLKTECVPSSISEAVSWAYTLTINFLDEQNANYANSKLSEQELQGIDESVQTLQENEVYYDVQYDAQSSNMFHALSQWSNDAISLLRDYISASMQYSYAAAVNIYDAFPTFFSTKIALKAVGEHIITGLYTAYVTYCIKVVIKHLLGNVNEDDLSQKSIREQNVLKWKEAHNNVSEIKITEDSVSLSHPELKEFVSRDNISTRVTAVGERMRVVELISKNGFKNIAQGLISGRRILVQTHAYTTTTGVCNIYKSWTSYINQVYECNNIPFKVVKEWPSLDTAIIEIDLTVPLYKDSSKCLVNNSDDFNGIARHTYFVNSESIIKLDNNFTLNKNAFQVQHPVTNATYIVRPNEGLSYDISAPGLCGSLIIDSTKGLCGMHVAGCATKGFAFIFPRDILKEIIQLLDYSYSQHADIIDQTTPEFSGIRLFNTQIPFKHPLKSTSLTKSEMYDEINNLKIPVETKVPPNFVAYGSKTLEKIAQKSFKPIPYIDDRAIEFGKKCIDQFFVDFEDLSDFDTIKGIGEEGLSRLNKDSVNGCGYEHDKSLYIDFVKGELTPSFKEKIECFIKSCNEDNVQLSDLLFYEAFKDELRVETKKDKPRSFRVAPLHHTFLVKKLLGSLFIHCKKNMWNNQICVGMNPYTDWDTLFKRLKNNDICFDGDFGNWDGGAPAQIQDAISELTLKHYKGQHTKTLKVLLTSMVRTFVLIKEKIFVTTHSMPSGCWVTAFFNSLINRFLTALVLYTEKTKRGEEPTLKEFNDITDFTMGDDKICGTPHYLVDYFNALTVKNFSESIGMKYTDGEKGEIVAPSKPLHDCMFLKRSFKFHPQLGKIVGPLSLTTLLNTLKYKDSRKDYDEVMSGKLTAFQYEIFLHNNPKLRDDVLDIASSKSFYFPRFSDEHISKSMWLNNTYEEIMQLLGKNVQIYS